MQARPRPKTPRRHFLGIARGRPRGYRYFDLLLKHLSGDLARVFDGRLTYPRQLEIHLPADHVRPCNFDCGHCQGRLLERTLAPYEPKALRLFDELEGRIPYHIFGGAYSEPLLNPLLPDFLELTKKQGSFFGIHTNGSLLTRLERERGFLTRLCRIATSPEDYLSVSLDAGRPASHRATKRPPADCFDEIIEGVRLAVRARGRRRRPSIRLCYLLNRTNGSEDELHDAIRLAEELRVDSLRFSIPYDLYGKGFDKVREYKARVEAPEHEHFSRLLARLLSGRRPGRPSVFYIPPDCQDVDRMRFRQCIYCYYQITIGADGFVYRCSSTATPSFKMNRLGELPARREDFERLIRTNEDPSFDPSSCFRAGARCNRMALEVNLEWADLSRPKEKG